PGRVAPLGAEWPRPPGRHRGQLLPGRRGVQLARPRRPGPPGPPDGGFGGRHRGQLLVGPGVLRGLGAPRGRLGGEGGRPAPRRPPRALQGPDGGDGGLRPQLPPGLGITEVYVYQADTAGSAAEWAPVVAANPGFRFFAETGDLASMLSGSFADYAATAGFDGIYTYDAVRYGAPEMAATCAAARQRRLLCSPSVAPGFDARRSGAPQLGVVDAAGGARYDTLWRSALAAGADVVSVTS